MMQFYTEGIDDRQRFKPYKLILEIKTKEEHKELLDILLLAEEEVDSTTMMVLVKDLLNHCEKITQR